MGKKWEIKYSCALGKNVGKKAHKKFMFCEGFYVSTGIPFYDEYYGYKTCAECKECKKYLYRKQYINLFYAVAISLSILAILILGTPQGAIRRNLFFAEGIREAFLSSVEKTGEDEDTGYWHYSVAVKGEQQEWIVIPWHDICIARNLTE